MMSRGYLSGRAFAVLAVSAASVFYFFLQTGYAQQPETKGKDAIRSGSEPFSIKLKQESLKSADGQLYAHIAFLFMDNPHFINLINPGSVSELTDLSDNYKQLVYDHYLNSIKNTPNYSLAYSVGKVYSDYRNIPEKEIQRLEKELETKNIVIKVAPPEKPSPADPEPKGSPSLHYCIFGEKIPLTITHPLFDYKDPLFYVHPFVVYDEFSTSNSTAYNDMVYIDLNEVENDYRIAAAVLQNRKTPPSALFVGAPVDEDIKACLKNAFRNIHDVKPEIWRMFVIHEMTHKILNVRYRNFEQVRGEETALSSTVYDNPRLGLAVMYSYLSYQALSPHRIAAHNFLSFFAGEKNDSGFTEDYSKIRKLSDAEIKSISKKHFENLKKTLPQKK
jgi:hypothetical protein